MNDLIRYRLCAELSVPPAAKLLYCYLLDISGGRHHSAVLSVKKLAKDMGFSRSAASRNLHRLEKLNMIGIVPRYTEDGGRLSNQYVLK
jgi:DNA-binding MarR family transcriptional regulator